MTHFPPILCLVGAVVLLSGCVQVHTKVEPIDINVNVRVKVDRELDDFFGPLDERDPTLQPAQPPSQEGKS